ncbi:hypothetical protein FRB94_003143 [Tulasnella sp. JGI-2019a]|nr:hypothetical protein FRB93_005217 [Tulasnella sp. JGI-2019a]KAG9003375.1 hypothetical protein FRB94_003143 [Tulasnella sp. JGI-2019a]
MDCLSATPASSIEPNTIQATGRPYPALSIPEVLLEVLENLSAQQLESAALVCRAWVNPAMDTKWRVTGIPLSRLLGKLAPIKSNQSSHKVLAHKKPITQDAWNHFLNQYANRVTKLVVDIYIDLNVIATLVGRFGGPFCSNISSLEWSISSCSIDYFGILMDLALGVRVRQVSLPYVHDAGMMTVSPPSQYMPLLALRAPNISKITMDGPTGSFDYRVFSKLVFLSHTGALSQSDYKNLSSCSHLQVLQLGWAGTDERHEVDTTAVTFPRLRELSILEATDELEAVMHPTTTPDLHTLRYSRPYSWKGELTCPLLNHILKTSPFLNEVIIYGRIPSSQLELATHDGVQALSFSNISDTGSDMEVGDLSRIGHAFPKLKRLILYINRYGSRGPHSYSWHWSTLPSLVSHFQHLQHLTISLHVPVSSLSGTITSSSIPTLGSLSSITFIRLHIQAADLDTFAQYLAALCPNVQSMEFTYLGGMSEDGTRIFLHDAGAFIDKFFGYRDQRDEVGSLDTRENGDTVCAESTPS